jgi:anaerobic dimethyl sulfoxide reductase subunit A
VRGINADDPVIVFNQRGKVRIPAYLTHRIMPGIVAMGEGAWYCPDSEGIDLNACANVLTRDLSSPGGALASNTCLVEVEKANQ